MRHGTCFRHRLSAHRAGAAPHSAVAELGVVRRLAHAHPNENLSYPAISGGFSVMSDQLFQWTLTFVIISMLVCPLINLVGGDEKAIGCIFSFLSAFLLVIVLFVGGIIVEVSKNSPVASGLLIAVLAAIGLFHWFMAITNCGAKRDKTHGLKCPKCHKRGANRNYSRSDYYLTTERKTVTHYDSDKEVSGYSEYEVPKVDYSVSSWVTCPHCGHGWE